MERKSQRSALAGVVICAGLLAMPTWAAAPKAAPAQSPQSAPAYQHLLDAANAAVTVRSKAIANARSIKTLGEDRTGSGVLIAPEGLVLTIGYLILEADQVEITTARGRTLPATVVAYDHATGFGLLRPIGPLDVKPIKLGSSARVESLDRLMTVGGGGEDSVTVATVVSRRAFAGYWEYLLDDAIFTAPPRPDHSGAALVNKEGELVGIGSLFVMDAATPGERSPGNMFVPIDLLKPILAEMIRTGRQKGGMRPWIGVSSLEEDGRIKVLRVSDDSPAAEAGITPGDIILSMGGQKLENLPDFYRRLWSSGAPGVEVQLKVLHGTEVREVTVKSIDRATLIRRKPTI
ncbi:MAG: serine protease [Burkholderiales bacterium]|nr:serine protease [Burkholderiales bacterium]